MIIHPQFVYLHFPKTGGTRLASLIRRHFADIDGLQIESHDGPPGWHDSIADREARDPSFSLGDRAVVVGFRLLPLWLHSRYAFELRRSPGLPHDHRRLAQAEFLEEDGSLGQADRYARHWLPPAIVKRAQFIRVEDFAGDFRRVLGQWLPVQRVPDLDLRIRENAGEMNQAAWDFIALHWDEVYRCCPWWVELERRVYLGVAP